MQINPKLLEKIKEAVPSIMVTVTISKGHTRTTERTIRLADVLIAIEENYRYARDVKIGVDGYLCCDGDEDDGAIWNLKNNDLSQQSPALKALLERILL